MSFPSHPSVAILFGMPTSRDRFDKKAKDSTWDYGRSFLACSSSDSAWTKYSEEVADVANKLILRAREYGFAVETDASLADVKESSRFADTMIIVAHWKGHLVAEGDLFADAVERVLNQTKNEDPLVQRVASRLKKQISNCEPSASRRLLALALNEEIATESAILGSKMSGAGPEINSAFARNTIDKAFGAILVPGNRLELIDGLHPPEHVACAVDKDYRGIIDFACCTSVILATSFKHIRGDSVRVLFSRGLLLPAQSMQLILEAISIMYATGGAYAEIKLGLDQALRDHLTHRD